MNAPEKIVEIKAFITVACSAVTALLGWTGVAVAVMLVCMALDYVSGSAAALRRGEWSSKRAREGLWHKAGEIIAVLVAALCDLSLHAILASAAASTFGEWRGRYFTLLVSIWYIFTELGSILENCAQLGAPVPEILIRGIRKLKKKVEPEEDQDGAHQPTAAADSPRGEAHEEPEEKTDSHVGASRLPGMTESENESGEED